MADMNTRPNWCDIVAYCAVCPRTTAEIVEAFGPRARTTIYNLVRSGRLVNLGDTHGGHACSGLYAASEAAKATLITGLNGRTPAPQTRHDNAREADRFAPIALELAWMGRMPSHRQQARQADITGDIE